MRELDHVEFITDVINSCENYNQFALCSHWVKALSDKKIIPDVAAASCLAFIGTKKGKLLEDRSAGSTHQKDVRH